MPTGQRSFDLTPGTDLNESQVGFVPLSVMVDNYSPYWLLLPDAGRYVPPYTGGGTYPLIHAQSFRAIWSTPAISGVPPVTSYLPTAGLAHLTFVESELTYVSASSLPSTAFIQSEAFSFAEGTTLSLTGGNVLGFLAIGVRVDNPGGTPYVLGSTGIIVPAWTIGFTADITPAFNSIVISPTSIGGNAGTTRGGPVVITFYANAIGNSPGTQLPIPTDTYLFTTLQCDRYSKTLFGIHSLGPAVYIRSITITNNTGATINPSIYAATPNSLAGGTVVTPVTSDPASPVWATVATARRALLIAEAPVLVPFKTSAKNSTASGTTVIVTIPGSVVAGDLLVVCCGSSTGSRTFSLNNGPWTTRASQNITGTSYLFSRTATGGDANTTITATISSTATTICVILGVYPSTFGAASNGNTTQGSSNSLTQPTPADLSFAIGMVFQPATVTFSSPAVNVANSGWSTVRDQIGVTGITIGLWDAFHPEGVSTITVIVVTSNTSTTFTNTWLVGPVQSEQPSDTGPSLISNLATVTNGSTVTNDVRALVGAAGVANAAQDIAIAVPAILNASGEVTITVVTTLQP